MNKRHINIPVFVPHSGCPNDCSFCNQRKITGQAAAVTKETAEKIIEDYLATIKRENTNIEIAFFGGSFTGIPFEEQKNLLEVASKYVKSGQVDGIRLSTRPDYITEEILDYLKFYGVTAIELGVQSMKDDVLISNNRGHSANDAQKAADLIKKRGFELGLQMMTGLYKDDYSGAVYTAEKIIELAPACVRIYPTLTIKDTKLEELYNSGEYIPMTLEETVELCAELLSMFEKANIKVLRLGLLGTDNINAENDVVAGPFHDSIGELCKSRKFCREILNDKSLEKKEQIKIYVNPKFISVALGHKRKNIEIISKATSGKKVEILQRKDIPEGKYIIE